MNDEPLDLSNAPPPPPEVEQAVLMGHIPEAISAYITHTGVDRETAKAVVDAIAAEHS